MNKHQALDFVMYLIGFHELMQGFENSEPEKKEKFLQLIQYIAGARDEQTKSN